MAPPPVWLDVTETLASGMRTGIQRVTIELARELLRHERGRLIRFNFRTRNFVLLTEKEIGSLFLPSIARHVSVWHRWAGSLGLTSLLGALKDAWLAVFRWRRGINPDWAGGTYATAEVLGNLVRFDAVRRLQTELPTILVLHDLFPLTAPHFSSLRRRAFERHWRLVVGATKVVAVSEFTRQEAFHYSARVGQTLPPIVVSHPGHSTIESSREIPTLRETDYFLCVGTVERRKNQAGLLAAFLRYRHAGGRSLLVFVGTKGPGSERLARSIEEASTQGVVWYRRADDTTLAWLYGRARALLYPSLAEGFGLPLVEALALGTPCLTSDRSSTAEVAALCGGSILVDPEDETALVNALRQFDQVDFRERVVGSIRRDRIPTWQSFASPFTAEVHPLRLVFDVSSLGYGTLGPQHRTGLFQVTSAYAQELRKHPGVQLGLYTSSGNRLWASRALRDLGWTNPTWVGNPAAGLLCFGARSLEFAVYRSPLRAFTPFFSALRTVSDRYRAFSDKGALAQWQAYLSPQEAIPSSVRGLPRLVTAVLVHDLIPLILPEYHQDPNDPTRWFSALWKSVTPSDLVFTVSEATRQDWLRRRPDFPVERVLVALNGVDTTRFRVGVPRLRPSSYFFAVSTVEPRKRLDAVLSGYRAYRNTGGTTPLLVAGHDPEGTLSASEGVELLGFVKDAELPGLYSGCAAFLSLSEYEGFGLPILEAMACGAPVVVSNRSSHPEVAGEAAFYVEPDDPETTAAALARLDNPQERVAAAQRSVAQAARFRWDRTVARVVQRLLEEKDNR